MYKHIYFDFTCCYEIAGNFGRFSGATNYASVIFKHLIKQAVSGINIHAVLPQGSDKNDLSDLGISMDNEQVRMKYVTDIKYIVVKGEDALLFIPAVYGGNLIKIPQIKNRNPHLRIYATLHDRQHNYYKYDWLDRFYHGNNIVLEIPGYIKYLIKKGIFNAVYPECVSYIDKIFTVSNYSMQMLENKRVKNIKFFIQGNVLEEYTGECERQNFVLLVGGGREEKNLLRTLIAFCKYKKETGSDLKFVTTGVKNAMKKKIKSCRLLDKEIIKKDVYFREYIDYSELSELYSKCKFVVFTSKGEGYGLPVLEALSYGKAVLASRTTSVPEVAGASIMYCDPFSVDSIVMGFQNMDNDDSLNLMEDYIKDKYVLIKAGSELDMQILCKDLQGLNAI